MAAARGFEFFVNISGVFFSILLKLIGRIVTVVFISSCDLAQVSNFSHNQRIMPDSMALYETNQIDILAHAECMRPELLQYAEFTADIFALR